MNGNMKNGFQTIFWKEKAWWKRQLPVIFTFLLCILMFLTIGVFSSSFVSRDNIRNIIQQATILGIASIGQTLIIMTGGIDLSVPGMMGVAGVLLVRLTPENGNILFPMLVGIMKQEWRRE